MFNLWTPWYVCSDISLSFKLYSLILNNVKQVFVYICPWIYSLVKFISHFSIGLSIYFYWHIRTFIYLNRISLLDIYIYHQIYSVPFHCIYSIFWEIKVQNSNIVQFTYFPFQFKYFVFCLRNTFLTQGHWDIFNII